MDQTLTNKKFIEQMDSVITKLGGTPVDLELTEDQEDDMVLNGVFASKIDEVIKALGGTPAEISVAENNMVSNAAFQVKMEDVVKNMESGGGGEDLATITIINDFSQVEDTSLNFIMADVYWMPSWETITNPDPFYSEDQMYATTRTQTSNLVMYVPVYSYINSVEAWTLQPEVYIANYQRTLLEGAIEYIEEGVWAGHYKVTGDCTMTIQWMYSD